MPDPTNILFTCGGRRVTLLRAFRRAMDQLGIEGKIVVTEQTEAAPSCHVADAYELTHAVTQPEYLDQLLRIVHHHAIKLIVPLTDLDLQLLSDNRGLFEQRGAQVMIASLRVVEICRDKFRTAELVRGSGLEPINTFTVEKFLTHPFYPCFVKPVEGSAAFGASIIRDARELRVHLATYGSSEMMVQEYVPGQEFTIDVYRAKSGVTHAVVPRQRLQVRSGEVQKGVTVCDKAIMDATLRLAEQLNGIWGVFCCQGRRLDEDSPIQFFEINPRFGGGCPLSIAAGSDLPLYLLQDLLGLPVTGEVGTFTDGLVMLRHDDAVFYQTDDIAQLPGYDTPEFR
jgi:carbamoyl-phosphate synthase large subunit